MAALAGKGPQACLETVVLGNWFCRLHRKWVLSGGGLVLLTRCRAIARLGRFTRHFDLDRCKFGMLSCRAAGQEVLPPLPALAVPAFVRYPSSAPLLLFNRVRFKRALASGLTAIGAAFSSFGQFASATYGHRSDWRSASRARRSGNSCSANGGCCGQQPALPVDLVDKSMQVTPAIFPVLHLSTRGVRGNNMLCQGTWASTLGVCPRRWFISPGSRPRHIGFTQPVSCPVCLYPGAARVARYAGRAQQQMAKACGRG